jgi:hypothetical protein
LKGENVNLFFGRLASVLFNESIKSELENEKSESKQTQRSIGDNLLVNSSSQGQGIKLSMNRADTNVFDFLIEKKCC